MASYLDQIPFLDHTQPGRSFNPLNYASEALVHRIGQASQVPAECVRMNHDLVRDGVFDLVDLDKIAQRDVCFFPSSTHSPN